MCFIDIKKALDRIRKNNIWKILKKGGVNRNTIYLIKDKGKKNIVKKK